MENNDFLTIIERIKSLEEKIDDYWTEQHPRKEPYESGEVNELYAALAVAQTNMPAVSNTNTNPWFDSPYTTIFEITRRLYPVLGTHGLSITQPKRITDDGGTTLYTRLCHSSGQWLESRVRVIPPKNDIDSYRSTLNALRVAEILSVLGLGVQNDPMDDDGEISMIEPRGNLAKAPTQKDIKAKKETSDVITKEQREELEYEMGDYTDLAEEIMERCHVRSISDIPKSQFRNAVTFIRKNKQAREGK